MSTLKASSWLFVIASLVLGGVAVAQTPAALPAATASQPAPGDAIDRVWSGHFAKYALLTTSHKIYMAYYDSNRQLTVAQRDLKGTSWRYIRLNTWNGWDSHNYIAMAADAGGRIHIAANMHAEPVIYFRSDASGEIDSFKRIDVMANRALERSMTYPIFLHDQAGRLIYKYRDGSSGKGNEIYIVFDEKKLRWKPLLSVPLTDGEGQHNAYFMGPVLGPDKFFHIAWVWRDSPMAETNHDLSYAKSRDLIHWQKADGTPYTLPIKLGGAEIVDPVPVKGGMINNNTVIGFDGEGRVMITYHKYDDAGNTQIWVARREGDHWHSAQISDWKNYRWDFSGGGSLNSEIFVSGAHPIGNGQIDVPVIRLGQSLDFIIADKDLKPIEARPVKSLTDTLKDTMTVPEGMQLNVVEATSDAQPKDGDTGYAIAWTTRPPHRDVPTADIPPPSTLEFITLKRVAGAWQPVMASR